MPKQKNEPSVSAERLLTLHIVTPDAEELSVPCDSVRFPLRCGKNGQGGGLCGVHFGHAPAVFALGEGVLTVLRNGETVLCGTISEGFAQTDGQELTLLTEAFRETDSSADPAVSDKS